MSQSEPDIGRSLLAELDALYRTARYLTGDPALAEDMVQEVSLKVLRGRNTFRAGADFRPWVFAILRHTIADYFRREQIQPVTVSLDEDNFDLTLPETVDNRIFEYVLDEEIEEALAQLPFEMRLAVLLADIEEFSYREIAEVLGWPLGSVMSRLYRGRQKLREQLLVYAKRRGYP